ncbi:MAG TPA: ribosome silencing factor [Acidimicrobiales bacterium]|nr:ribosome silencing factor [Acidimicrobiales bacterium]
MTSSVNQLTVPVEPAVAAFAPGGAGGALDLALVAARAAATKTLEETSVLDVGDLLGITDYFVVTAGRNDRQVRAIVDEVARGVREAGGTQTRRVEGLAGAEWVLVDYGSFVVHVFGLEARARFGLERLWSDAPSVAWDSALAGERSQG